MKQFNRQKGYEGENLAANYLKDNGYRLITRNYSTKFGEIDIICQDGNTLVFVEVKTKTNSDFGLPEEMFTKAKLAKVKKIATYYLLKNHLNNISCRIDLIAIDLCENGPKPLIKHYQNLY